MLVNIGCDSSKMLGHLVDNLFNKILKVQTDKVVAKNVLPVMSSPDRSPLLITSFCRSFRNSFSRLSARNIQANATLSAIEISFSC